MVKRLYLEEINKGMGDRLKTVLHERITYWKEPVQNATFENQIFSYGHHIVKTKIAQLPGSS